MIISMLHYTLIYAIPVFVIVMSTQLTDLILGRDLVGMASLFMHLLAFLIGICGSAVVFGVAVDTVVTQYNYKNFEEYKLKAEAVLDKPA